MSRIDPRHTRTRGLLRVSGPAILLVGGVLTVVGVGSFFASLGTFAPPRYFWCAFVGLPLVALGIALTQFGFMGSVSRYFAGEVAPVQKDTFNYLAEGTKQGVRTTAEAVGEGWSQGLRGGRKSCPACGHSSPADANFCEKCGNRLEHDDSV